MIHNNVIKEFKPVLYPEDLNRNLIRNLTQKISYRTLMQTLLSLIGKMSQLASV